MKFSEEKEYYDYLEKTIREQKSESSFWNRNSNSYDMDILLLLNHIQKKNPHLIDRIFGNFIDVTGKDGISRQDILNFMGKTDKGTVCKWKDENGEEILLMNNGQRFSKKSKQILVFGKNLNKDDLELFKKSMYGSVLKRDVQKIYDKISRDENIRKKSKSSVSFTDSIATRNEKIDDHSASSFEKNFKLLVKEQGTLCIPHATADTMLAFMPGTEKQKLAQNLASIGVKNENDWEHLLDKWKNEALEPDIEITYKRTVKPRSIEITHLR